LKLTFIDSGVLITAATGTGEFLEKAMEVLDDPGRTFVSSDYVKLEVLPKAAYHGNEAEAEYYRAFFESVSRWTQPSPDLAMRALDIACRFGLGARDALHVAAAEREGAEELVTSEKRNKPLFRVTTLQVTSIRDDNGVGTL
jgi:predicted nucleic acid-binding protein